MFRIAVVEDEERFTKQVQEYFGRYQQESKKNIKVTFFTDGEDFIEAFNCDYDMVLLDIQMKFLDGFSTAQILRERDTDITLIFITAVPQYAIRGYSVGALDYLLKPVSYFAFSQLISRALDKIEKRHEKQYFMYPIGGALRKLDTDEIYYIECNDHTITFYMKNEQCAAFGRLQDIEKRLETFGKFYRCNKGCLINTDYVDGICNGSIIVCGTEIPMSRGKKAGLLQVLSQRINITEK